MSSQSHNSSFTNHSATATRSEARNRCTHSTVDGRRCRLPVMDQATGLCFRHFELRNGHGAVPDPEVVADELLGSIENFSSADSINLLLSNLVKQLARKRIARPDAIALAYIGQLLLNSLPAMEKQFEQERYSASESQIFAALRRAHAARAAQCEPPAANSAAPLA